MSKGRFRSEEKRKRSLDDGRLVGAQHSLTTETKIANNSNFLRFDLNPLMPTKLEEFATLSPSHLHRRRVYDEPHSGSSTKSWLFAFSDFLFKFQRSGSESTCASPGMLLRSGNRKSYVYSNMADSSFSSNQGHQKVLFAEKR